MVYKSLLKPILFQKDAESAHESTIRLARQASRSSLLLRIIESVYGFDHPDLKRSFWGLNFPNPVGIAAGFDKNGETPRALQALGFGFVEIGSITAQPSHGNPRPRAFRLPEDQSLINRMGLNNQGAEKILGRLSRLSLRIPLGINIAKTNDASIHGDDALEDYQFSYKLATKVADYITVNISCPNTGEGKTFEDPDALEALLKTLDPSASDKKPTLVKFSVDTDQAKLERLVELCERYGISGYVATNTSSIRSGLNTPQRRLDEIGNGGLSGAAIEEQSTQVVKWLNEILKKSKPIVGVGGINSPETALAKMAAGADLLQVYTGLVYEGPGLIKKIKKGLIQ